MTLRNDEPSTFCHVYDGLVFAAGEDIPAAVITPMTNVSYGTVRSQCAHTSPLSMHDARLRACARILEKLIAQLRTLVVIHLDS